VVTPFPFTKSRFLLYALRGMATTSPPRRRGRPPGKEYPIHVGVQLRQAQALTLFKLAQRQRCTRSEAVRRLLDAAEEEMSG
jgi:hypothetical protein